ncbi:hypothetical protein [Butyrivibrio sp. WCD3002]|uniref:hypothetical protein n=1 Tax=Butyrivibrio sp. WCD3002 TaxID=1280676 RepID=UPI000408ED96|nr:hypothetical protein [Butyrivibrio sp. WCD3002]
MLGKLLKHEFKATWKYFLAIDAITIVLGIIAGIVGYAVAGKIDDFPPTLIILLTLGLVGYIFALVSASVLTTVFNVVHYYRSLYTAEGYLTFTLPATTTEILSAKMLVAVIWQVIMALSLATSVFFLAGSFFLYGTVHGAIDIQEFFGDFWYGIMEMLGIAGVFGTLRYIVSVIMSIVFNMLIFFFSISIGQLWQKHKILGSIIAFFVTRFVMGIFSFVVNMMSGAFGMLLQNDTDPGRYFSHTTVVSLLISVVASVVMYVASIWITDKKLNLD